MSEKSSKENINDVEANLASAITVEEVIDRVKAGLSEAPYLNDFHRKNSMAAQREVQQMMLHPYSREQKIAQIQANKARSNARKAYCVAACDTGVVNCEIPVVFFEDSGCQIAYCPALDIAGYGKSRKDAEESFKVVVEEYLTSTLEKRNKD